MSTPSVKFLCGMTLHQYAEFYRHIIPGQEWTRRYCGKVEKAYVFKTVLQDNKARYRLDAPGIDGDPDDDEGGEGVDGFVMMLLEEGYHHLTSLPQPLTLLEPPLPSLLELCLDSIL